MSERKPPVPDRPSYVARPIDSAAMKAFAHPLRLAMYDYLNDRGSATATMLAKHTGESTGQTSYHLRQLERHGFVTDDTTRGTGRERWWKAVGFSMRGRDLAADSENVPALRVIHSAQIDHRSKSLIDWFQRSRDEDPEWAEASVNNRHTITMTQSEAANLSRELMETIDGYYRRSLERQTQDDLRRVRVYLDVFPLPREDQPDSGSLPSPA